MVLYDPKSEERLTLHADTGWRRTQVKRRDRTVQLRWQGTQDERFGDITVTASVDPKASESALEWSIRVDNGSDWAVYEVAFLQAGFREMDDGELFFPFNEGVVEDAPWAEGFETFNFIYPKTHSNLQYLSVYEPSRTGLYLGVHDAAPTHKSMTAKRLSDKQDLRLRFRHLTPDMIKTENDFKLSGKSVWRLFEGDWYDAALVYRKWAKQQKWYPQLGADGREDTPDWMKELPVWIAVYSGNESLQKRIDEAKKFAEFVDVPVSVHWYGLFNHEFDNDYPKYPAKEGFADGVAELQDAGLYVMPYINSRLWDTRLDSFAETGRVGACKNPAEVVYEVNYGNRTENNGSLVRMAVMDPSTDVWQDTVQDISLRLFNEYGVDGVYFDQLGNLPEIFPQ